MRNPLRISLTLAALCLYFVANALFSPQATLIAGQQAGSQFEANDWSYISTSYLFSFLHTASAGLTAALILVLVALWYKPARKRIKQLMMVGLTAFLFMHSPARAYYDKTDYAEPYFVLPNESAFWVPDVGDNKNSQVQFGSLAYFQANKIAAKRFVIPHIKLDNSGLFSNFYVPAGRLIVVDRTPYSREWVKSSERGTSKKDQSFPCQSVEGLNITLEISIGVSVTEEDAATYLYRFGTSTLDGNRTDPNVVFTSVLHGRSLTEVMDTVGRNKVQALMCNEVTVRTFDDANLHALDMMNSVKAKADEYFKSVGIRLDYLGWAGTLEFDSDVQKAINQRYTLDKLRPVVDVQRQIALNEAIVKWNGQLPGNSITGIIPTDLWSAVLGWFTGLSKESSFQPAKGAK